MFLGITHGFTPDAAQTFVYTLLIPLVPQPQVLWPNAPYGYWPASGGPYKVLGYGPRIIDIYTRSPVWINEVKTGPNVSFNSKYSLQGEKDGGLVAEGHFLGATWWFLPNTACLSGPTPNFLNFLVQDEHINVAIFECTPGADDNQYTQNEDESKYLQTDSQPVDLYDYFPSPAQGVGGSCPG